MKQVSGGQHFLTDVFANYTQINSYHFETEHPVDLLQQVRKGEFLGQEDIVIVHVASVWAGVQHYLVHKSVAQTSFVIHCRSAYSSWVSKFQNTYTLFHRNSRPKTTTTVLVKSDLKSARTYLKYSDIKAQLRLQRQTTSELRKEIVSLRRYALFLIITAYLCGYVVGVNSRHNHIWSEYLDNKLVLSSTCEV